MKGLDRADRIMAAACLDAQLRAWAELTPEVQIALDIGVNSIHKQWFENHHQASNPLAVIYSKIDRQ
jgi:hypothetical protein